MIVAQDVVLTSCWGVLALENNIAEKIAIADMINVRVFYHKMSRAKYISHLDITRLMQRALKRSGLPVWYTEGFNPHIYLTFALPLSLGYESKSETMDMRLMTAVPFDEVKDRMNSSLPADIRVIKVDFQKNKPEVIKTALYDVTIQSKNISGDILKDCLENFMSQEKIEVVKKSKRASKVIDIKPDIKIGEISVAENSIRFELEASAGIEKNINPTLMTDEMIGKYSLEGIYTAVLRKRILDANRNDFE